MKYATALTLGIVLAVAASMGAAFAGIYPDRDVHIIVPFPVGGLNDNIARILQEPLQQELKQTIVIENRSGASGIVGANFVAKSRPDGYTLLIVASSFTVSPATHKKLPYDIERDFAPISILARDPLLFVINSSLRAKTLPEFIALAKSEPGKINYATPGTASQSHLEIELLGQKAGIKLTEIPYRGGAPALLSLISNQTQFAALSAQLTLPHIRSGQIRAIASGGPTRDPHFPNVPTLSEAGVHGVEALQWVGLLAPAGTPAEVVHRLNDAVKHALLKPAVVQKLAARGVTPAANSPSEFRKLLVDEIRKWKDVAQKAGIAPQ